MSNPNQLVQDDIETEKRSVNVTVDEPIGAGFGEIHAEDTDVEFLVAKVREHLVAVRQEAPVCCIDGRCARCCVDGSPAEVGPSVAGGGLASAYAAAELVGWFASDASVDQVERFKIVADRLRAAGVVTGAHCDTDNFDSDFVNGGTGCGAVDRMGEILAILHREKTTVDSFTNSLLDDGNAAAEMSYISSEILAQRMENWDKRSLYDMLVCNDPSTVEVLKGDPSSKTHGHAEQAVVFNFVKDTTVDRDAFHADTGSQVFVVDVWCLDHLAAALAEGPDAARQQRHILHAMTAYQVATYLALCDGSQRPIFVKP